MLPTNIAIRFAQVSYHDRTRWEHFEIYLLSFYLDLQWNGDKNLQMPQIEIREWTTKIIDIFFYFLIDQNIPKMECGCV